MDQLAGAAEQWRAMGVDSFIMNRCPRCPTHNLVLPKGKVISRDEIDNCWAVSKAIRDWRGEAMVRAFMAVKGTHVLPQQRAILETLRDHVDYCIPYVHWLIAMIAGAQGDEAARVSATLLMQEFGPDFLASDTLRGVPPDYAVWRDSLGRAYLGLLGTFGMLDHFNNQTVH